ncbi:uncharacterized protein LOC129927713 [Biomphalaria glabrata]|uniref:Uncharacterized protein LOC129927713 n=1 Tax=Biomphalaria glabrata TaxID=6526 RepID=A0A9W3B3L0_BIOGL|nr:uncharacterized protein LOC129927713 [Biomphalaria glabrata]
MSPFDESQNECIDSYLLRFEDIATSCNLPQTEWARSLMGRLKGRAINICLQMRDEERKEYVAVKEALRRQFGSTSYEYRRRLKESTPLANDDPQIFVTNMSIYFDRWVDLSKVDHKYETLREHIIMDAVMEAYNNNVKTYVTEREPKTISSLIAQLRQYKAAHPMEVTNHITDTCFYNRRNRVWNNRPRDRAFAAKHANKLQVYPGFVGEQMTNVLYDTGATAILVAKEYVNPQEYTGRRQDCVGYTGQVTTHLVARINIHTPFISGWHEALVLDNKPDNIGLIIGCIKGSKPCTVEELNKWKEKYTQKCSMVTTRAQKKAEEVLNTNDNIQVPYNNENENTETENSDMRSHNQVNNPNEISTESQDPLHIKTEQFVSEQKNDPDLIKLIESEAPPRRGLIKIGEDGAYVREIHLKAGKTQQLLVPKKYRETILKLAHDTPFAGHMGVKRTLNRILNEFFWPRITQEVKAYIKSCHICQIHGAKGTYMQAPIQTTDLSEMPFEKIAVDIIGPMPVISGRGHRYILTVVDMCTRFPEAIPLKRISSEDVGDALTAIFARTGYPRIILSDQGTQFKSNEFAQFCKTLNIKQQFAARFHPQANGMCERLNSTLKTMLNKVAQDNPTDWDKLINPILFAYREVPHTTTGFSPFEMLYGSPVRGPMSLYRDFLVNRNIEHDVHTGYDLVIKTRQNIIKACETVQKQTNREKPELLRKLNQGRKLRTLQVDDNVMVLLPDRNNQLFIKWQGPFQVTKVISKVDYSINIRGRDKVFHINMLKLYMPRPFTLSTNANQDTQDSCRVMVIEPIEEADDV